MLAHITTREGLEREMKVKSCSELTMVDISLSLHTPAHTHHRLRDNGRVGWNARDILTYLEETECLHGVDFRHDVGVHVQDERCGAALSEHEGAERFPHSGLTMSIRDSSSLGDDEPPCTST